MAWQEFLTGGRRHNFHIVFKRIFFSKNNLKLIEKQERFWGGTEARFPGKFLKTYIIASRLFCVGYLALRSLVHFLFLIFPFLHSIAQCRIVQFLSLLGISYIVIKGERLQTRRPRQFLVTGHMVFSQPLTRKTLRNFPF